MDGPGMDASGAPDVPSGSARLVGLPALDIAERVRSGALSAVDVVRAHLDHLEDVEARVGAFRVVRRAAALAEAAAVDAAADRASLPLAGVPVAVKENIPVSGIPCTAGWVGGPLPPADEDHPVVARVRAAGAVVVGITRMPELGLYATTDEPGAVCRNPWDTARSPAGSSGGSAAAVAAGCVPLALGNDGLGSLRLPAAACGLVTLKPGRDVVPTLTGDWFGMVENGALATTVADLAEATALLADGPVEPAAPDRPLRIAVSTRSPLPGLRADGSARAALEGVAAELAAAGHTVVRRTPAVPPAAAAGTVARWMAAADLEIERRALDRRTLLPRTRTHARVGALVRRARLVRPATAERFRSRMTAFFADVDVLLTPVTTGPPLPARPWHERSFLANAAASARWAPWTAAWNVSGLPAMSLPAGVRPEGLPLAVQLVGPPGAEGRLLWLAGELERRRPWRRHAPVFDPAGFPADTPA